MGRKTIIVAAVAGLVLTSISGCESDLPAPTAGRRATRAVPAGPMMTGSAESETLSPIPGQPLIVAELPNKKDEPIRVRTALDNVVPRPPATQATQPATQPLPPPDATTTRPHGVIDLKPTGTPPQK